MMHSLNALRKYEIAARDGTLGEVDDVFFDDRFWLIRYLVVQTGGWLSGRKVLISPESAEAPDPGAKTLPVKLSKEQVRESPGIGTDLPVSDQKERELRAHFGWASDWAAHPAGLGAGPLLYPGLFPPALDEEESEDLPKGDPNLRSAHEIEGYGIHATDGDVGSVKDFLIDESGWVVRYLVVDTGNWLPGRKVLLAPNWAERIEWADRLVHVAMTRDSVKESPRYDPQKEVDRDYEVALHRHYDRIGYWP